MKIIQIMDTLTSTGGVNTFVLDLCKALKKAGQDVILIGIIGDRTDEIAVAADRAGIPVYGLSMKSKKDALIYGVPKLRKALKSIIKDEQAICNLHLKLSVLAGGIATIGMRNVRCVETYHSFYRNYLLEYMIMSSVIKKYICCSEPAKEEFISRFHPPINKVVAIPNGIDITETRKAVQDATLEKDKRIGFLSVGRLTEQKNLHISSAAFSKMDESKCIYRIIGNGPLMEKAKNAANGSKSVEFLGTVTRREVVERLATTDMVVMPSLHEGLSIFMLEAMAMGCPLMISNVESLRKVVHENPLGQDEKWRCCQWGYLVSTSDIAAYQEAAQHFINNQQIAREMRRRILTLSEEYSMDKTAEKYIITYKSIIGH